MLLVDQEKTQDCFFDLVDFAKQEWNDMYYNIDGQRFSFEEIATASDVAEFPMARSRKTTKGREGLRRDFDPVARPEKGKGKGKGTQRSVFQQSVECWNCGQHGHRSFGCPSRPRSWILWPELGISKPLGRAGQMGKSWVVEPTVRRWLV